MIHLASLQRETTSTVKDTWETLWSQRSPNRVSLADAEQRRTRSATNRIANSGEQRDARGRQKKSFETPTAKVSGRGGTPHLPKKRPRLIPMTRDDWLDDTRNSHERKRDEFSDALYLFMLATYPKQVYITCGMVMLIAFEWVHFASHIYCGCT